MSKPKRQWLYKDGQEGQLFTGEAIDIAFKDGWVDTPAKCNGEVVGEAEIVEPTAEVVGESSEGVDLDTLSEEELRQLGKDNGIKSAHNKNLDKLKEELLALSDEEA